MPSVEASGRRCGVLGDPIAHSLSPVLHRAAYAELGLDWTYDAHRVPAGGLAVLPRRARRRTWRGLSLTMPLKREALAAGRPAHRPRAAGGGGQHARCSTTAASGSATTPTCPAPSPRSGSVRRSRWRRPSILGGGATATSIGLALVDLGVTSIEVLVRDESRAAETVDAAAGAPGGRRRTHRGAGRDRRARRRRRGRPRSRRPRRPTPGRALRRTCRSSSRRSTTRGRRRWPRRRRPDRDAGRRPRPARAPGRAAVRAVHRAAGAARRDAGGRPSTPSHERSARVNDTVLAAAARRSSSPGSAACWCRR